MMKQIKGEVVDIREETHDVKTFEIELQEPLEFTPGQYCLVAIPGNEEVEGMKRPFTFANAPQDTRDERLMELTVKKIGEFTTAMHNLEVGDSIEIEGPRGEALNFDERVKKDVVFLAGGSGITPFMSSLRYAVNKGMKNDLILVFSNRKEEDIIYREELKEIEKKENIEVVYTLDVEAPDDWQGEEGRIDEEMLEKYIEKPRDKLWYICGPPPMIDSMVEILEGIAVPEEQLRWEDWQISGKHD